MDTIDNMDTMDSMDTMDNMDTIDDVDTMENILRVLGPGNNRIDKPKTMRVCKWRMT